MKTKTVKSFSKYSSMKYQVNLTSDILLALKDVENMKMDEANTIELKDSITLNVMAELDKKIAQRENKRFRVLYILIGLVSFIGIGVITQIVDLYSREAVDSKLTEVRQEFQSAKLFSQLLALATMLDLSESFTHTDRDTVIKLLKSAQNNHSLRSEHAFVSLLEKIIDAFIEADNPMYVSLIYDMYRDECLTTTGISLSLIQHYVIEYLASTDIRNTTAAGNYERLLDLVEALDSQNEEGISGAIYALSSFKFNDEVHDEKLRSTLSSYQMLHDGDKDSFGTIISMMSDLETKNKNLTPKFLRVIKVVEKFLAAYQVEIEAIVPNDHIQEDVVELRH